MCDEFPSHLILEHDNIFSHQNLRAKVHIAGITNTNQCYQILDMDHTCNVSEEILKV